MDPDVARMLADLGNGRRDELSAPEEGRRDRFPSRSPREERMILKEAEDRRAKAHLNAKDEGEAATLKAWNTASTFGIDDVAEQMENRYSGQGHRARLRQEVSQYEPDHGSHYPKRSRQDYAQDEENRRMHYENYQARANAPGPARQRAPSPRSFGKVKFRGNQRLPQQPGVLAAASSIPTGNFTFTASTSGSSTSSAPAAAESEARPFAPVAQVQAPAQPVPKATPASAPAPAPETASQPKAALEAPTPLRGPAPAARTRAVGNITTTQAILDPPSSALPAAAISTPVPRSATAKSSTPAGVLSSVWTHLMKNKDARLSAPAPREKAKVNTLPSEAVELGSVAPETSRPSTPLPTKLPVEEWTSNSKGDVPIRKKKMLALQDAVEKEDQAFQWKADELHFLRTAREKIAEDIALLAQPEHSKQADDYYAHQRYRVWLRPYGAQARVGPVQDTDIPVIAEIVKATNDLLGKDAAAAAPPQSVANPRSTSARPPTPPSTASNSRSSSVGAQESTDLSSPPQPETAAGALGATFYNKNGVLLGNRQYSVDAPVIASITLTAKDSTYDVLGLADNMDSLAYQMGLRKATHAKYGYHLSDSGKYFD